MVSKSLSAMFMSNRDHAVRQCEPGEICACNACMASDIVGRYDMESFTLLNTKCVIYKAQQRVVVQLVVLRNISKHIPRT